MKRGHWNGCVCGHMTAHDEAFLRRVASRTTWPWDDRKVSRIAERLEMPIEKIERKLRKMKLGPIMRCSPCGYCCHWVTHFDSGFCPRGRKMKWRNCGETSCTANDGGEGRPASGRTSPPHGSPGGPTCGQ